MIICADDYGMRADIDRAILELCGNGKLSAVSCLALFERCDGAALEKLRTHEDRVDIGLHFCLTDENLPVLVPAGKYQAAAVQNAFSPRLASLVKARRSHLTARGAIRALCEKPGARRITSMAIYTCINSRSWRRRWRNFVRQLPADQRPYVRNTRLDTRELRQKNLPSLKAGFIGSFGRRLEQRLCAAGVATNDGFSGIYDFKNWQRYPEFFPKFAACLPGKNGILVTHPGFDENWRCSEFETLQKHAIGVNRFQR